MFKNKSRELIIVSYKIFLYGILLAVFVMFMSRINPNILKLTRTSVIVVSSFLLVTIVLIPVYGNFEIGQKKSKPVFFSSVISLFVTNVISFILLLIMGIKQYTVGYMLTKGILYLFLAFFVQVFITWYAAHLGNMLYFKLYEPYQTIIIHNNHKLLSKITSYITSHDKQYKLKKTYENPSFTDIDFQGVDNVISLDMGRDFENEIIEYCYYYDLDLMHNSDVYDMFSGNTKTQVIDDILMNYFPKEKMTTNQIFFKRVIDVVLSIIFLFLVSPLFLLVAIAIKLDDGGPVFFQQERLTINKKKFNIIKFRSMKLNSGNTPVQDNDDRITKIGHILRGYRIDEIPQFINILKGDMSIVGPRPESVEIMENILEDIPEFVYRLKVKGGLTGYAQIFGKYNTSPKQKVLLDLKYIESFSLINDIKLILQTFSVFFKKDSTEAYDTKED